MEENLYQQPMLIEIFIGQYGRGNPAYYIESQALSIEKMQCVSKQHMGVMCVFLLNKTLSFYMNGIETYFCVHGSMAAMVAQHIKHGVRAVNLKTQQGRLVRLSLCDDQVTLITKRYIVVPLGELAVPDFLRHPEVLAYYQGNGTTFIKLNTAEAVATYCPPLQQMIDKRLCVCVTAPHPNYDFCSRYFAPSYGQAEDMATGSAHVGLAQIWEEKIDLRQASAVQLSPIQAVLKTALRYDTVEVSGVYRLNQ